MCKVLKLSRSSYYYEATQKSDESDLVERIKEIFRASRENYGTRKIKRELAKEGLLVSRRRIGRIMKQEGLVSCYTVAQFKPRLDKCNESKIANVVNREFNKQPEYNVVVSDLTYVRVGMSWNYICVLVDLFNREIIGFSAGRNKDAQLVAQAFARVETSLENINIFHTDRGNKFKNKLIDETLETFHIERSLSMKGCPYDNACIESFHSVLKKEEIYLHTYQDFKEAHRAIFEYIESWYNRKRIHSAIDYLTPQQK